MKVLSLFDGISCARVALERVGFNVERYYASEVDKYAIQVSQKNYPNISQLGDVKNIKVSSYNGGVLKTPNLRIEKIDLLIGGSPCQDLSIAKKDRKGLDGERSGLFWEYVRILQVLKPKYFILENVNSMSKESKQIITETLGVEPIMINASLVSAQNRKRLFWTNIPNVTQPEDKGILLRDIIEVNVDEKYNINLSERYGMKGFCELTEKSKSMTASMYKGYGNDGVTMVRSCECNHVRKLTPIECERLQGLPDNYTEGVSNTQRYKCCGNAFNVDVVAHILSFIND